MESTTSPTFVWASRIHFLTRAERPLPGAAAGRGGRQILTSSLSLPLPLSLFNLLAAAAAAPAAAIVVAGGGFARPVTFLLRQICLYP